MLDYKSAMRRGEKRYEEKGVDCWGIIGHHRRNTIDDIFSMLTASFLSLLFYASHGLVVKNFYILPPLFVAHS
jgi:hypothetical protein